MGEADEVSDQIGAALGLYGRSTRSGAVEIVEYLRERTLLLVLSGAWRPDDKNVFARDRTQDHNVSKDLTIDQTRSCLPHRDSDCPRILLHRLH